METSNRIVRGMRRLQNCSMHEFVTDVFVQAKLNTRALLDQVFPDYEKTFSNLFSATSLSVLKRCLEDDSENLMEVIQEGVGKSHSKRWVEEKVERIEELLSIWRDHPISRAQTVMLSSMVTLLLTFIEQLGDLERQMNRITSTLPEVERLKVFPGLGINWLRRSLQRLGTSISLKKPSNGTLMPA